MLLPRNHRIQEGYLTGLTLLSLRGFLAVMLALSLTSALSPEY